MSVTEAQSAVALQALEACTAHGRLLLASQLPIVEARNYDFLPNFKEMTVHLYVVGVMWRFGEQFNLPTPARDRGFLCLLSMLVDEEMSQKDAQSRIAYLNQLSRTGDGRDAVAIASGYTAEPGDGSLAKVFDAFRNVPEV